MNRLALHDPLTAVLAALAALGLAALAFTLAPTLLWVSQPVGAEPVAAPIPRIEQKPFEDYVAIAERPLFNPGRLKDPAQPSVTAATQLPPLENYRLVGVVVSRDVKVALVERRESKTVVTLHPGDMLDGRRVDDIAETGLALSGANGAETLSIPKPSTGRWSIGTPRQ